MPAVSKIDLKKTEKRLYTPSSKAFELIDVPPMAFLMIDGEGDPNTSQAYMDAMEALYGLAYTLKFASKKQAGVDYVVMPLEGLWWAQEMAAFDAETTDKDAWHWCSMIRQPDHITAEMVAAAAEELRAKKDPAALDQVRFETYHEGLSVQIMHVGPYSEEGPTLQRLHEEYLPQNGLIENGKHHEIYLGDPRRTAPERLRTVLRQPVRRISDGG